MPSNSTTATSTAQDKTVDELVSRTNECAYTTFAKMVGIIYYLVNDAMPGLVKVGHTTGDIEVRLQQLNATGVPTAFRVVALFHVSDSAACESAVHLKLSSYRSNPRREFFCGTPCMLIGESLGIIVPYLCGGPSTSLPTPPHITYSPDEDDVYFMFYLLHGGYQDHRPQSSVELAEHHSSYSAIELDLKLMNLESHGFVERVDRRNAGIGEWMLTPNGAKFMIDGNHHSQELLDESKKG